MKLYNGVMNALQREMVKYAIEKSDRALEKAERLIKEDYLTDAPSKLFDAVFCIVMALAYATNFIEKPDKNYFYEELFYIWKSDKNKFMTDQNSQFVKWFKKISKTQLPKSSLYDVYKYIYQKNLTFDCGMVQSINKNDFIEDFEQVKNFIETVKDYIYTVSQ